MLKARDIMSKSPSVLGSELNLTEAADFFIQHQISTAPVQNPLGEIVGQIAEFDLVKAHMLSRSDEKYSKLIHAKEFFGSVDLVYEDDDLPTVLRAVMKSAVRWVLVKDERSQITGMVSLKDVLRILRGASRSAADALADEIEIVQQEIAKMRLRAGELSNYLQTYDVVFQSGLFGLHSVDKEGKIIFANERLHEMLGYPPGELFGKTIFDIYPPEIRVEVREGLKKVMAEGKHNLIYTLMVRSNGETIQVDIASAALRDERGRFIGTFSISRAHGAPAMDVAVPVIFPAGTVD